MTLPVGHFGGYVKGEAEKRRPVYVVVVVVSVARLDGEVLHKGALLVGLDSLWAVVRADPLDSLVGGCTGQHSQARQCGSRPTVATEATHLNVLPVSGSVEHGM